MGVYDAEVADALADIQEAGELCIFTLPSTEGDATKPWEDKADAADATVNGYVAFIPTGRIGTEGKIRSALAGNEIPSGLTLGFVGNSPVLTTKHICQRTNGRRYSIVNVDPLDVNGELIMQTVLFQLLKQ